MPTKTRFKVNTVEVEAALKKLKNRGRPAIARALNRSTASGKTMMVKQVSSDMGLKVSDVRPFVEVTQARPEKLQATFYASAKRVPLIDFRAKGPEPSLGRGKGVTAKLPGGAGRYPHAFIATMKSGHRGVFQRRPSALRKPVYELRGPSIWQSFGNHEEVAVARIHEQLAKNLPHELEFAMSKV